VHFINIDFLKITNSLFYIYEISVNRRQKKYFPADSFSKACRPFFFIFIKALFFHNRPCKNALFCRNGPVWTNIIHMHIYHNNTKLVNKKAYTMKNKTYHIVGTIPNSNIKIVGKRQHLYPVTQINEHSHRVGWLIGATANVAIISVFRGVDYICTI